MQTRQFSHSGDSRRNVDSLRPAASAAPTSAWIAIEGEAGQPFLLDRAVTRVGRSDPRSSYQPEIPLADDAVSRRHLEIRRGGGDFIVVDVGSTNGTWLNGQELVRHEGHPLQPGDRIVLGSESELVFGVTAAETTPTALPPSGPAATLARELAAARLEIRGLQEELARERRLSGTDGSPLGQRVLGEIARELDDARRHLDAGEPSPAATDARSDAPALIAEGLREELAALNAEIERRQADLERLNERHACLERHWGERLRQLDHQLAAEQPRSSEPAAFAV